MSAPQLSLSLPPNTTSFKRSFEQFGFDLESPASTIPHPAIDGSAASSESSSSATSPDGDENRRKRARSASSLSDPEDRSSEASTSTLSSFDSESVSTDSQSNSSQAAARRHLLLDLGLGRGLGSSVALGLSMASTELQLGGRAIEPPPRIPTPELLENNDVDMPDIDMSFPRHEDEEDLASPAEHVRRSVDRFNAFDRHISVLRSSSPPVIPLPASLSSRQTSLSPPTLPPLPLVDLGLDAEDDEEEDDHEQFPSTGSTNTTTSTPPRLDLNLPSTTSLSSGPNSPTVPRDESSSTQFRERLDSVIDGLGGGDLHFEAPTTYESATSADDRNRHNESPGATASGSNAPAGNFPIDAFAHRRPLVEGTLFDWPPSALDWNMTLGQPGGSAEAAQSPSSPPWRPARATAATDTAIADIRRFIGSSSPPPPRLYPRPASLAAPLSVPATSSRLDSPGLDSVDLVGAYLDFRNSTNSRARETALDRARALHRERERERDRERERRERERELEREREREREREEETERERDHPWSLDSIWETNPRGESSSSSALPRPWEALTRNRRELAAEGERELDLELARRRAMQRQLHLTLDRDRERQRDEQHARSQLATSVSRAERYLESGLVDPREASRPAPSTASLFDAPQAPERRLRPPSDTSNPFSVSWSSRRAREVEAEDPSSRPITHRAMSSSQSELASDAWLDYLSRDRPSELDDFFHTEPASSRSTNPRSGPSSSVARDLPEYSRHGGETSASGDIWRARSTAVWQPRLAVSPQSTAQPTRTATHARAQSIATPTLSSMTAQPSIHRLRSRLYGPPRAAGVGSTNSLVAESAAAIRRREARSELMERLNRTISMDIDALSDPESDWEPFSTTPRASFPERNSGLEDEDMDSEEDRPHLPRRIADAIQHFESRSRPAARHSRALRFQREMEGNSPSRQSPPLSQRLSTGSIRSRSIPGRAPSEPEHEEQSAASSSGLNSRQPLSIHSRRPVSRRQHPISGEISPPPPASASVDRRHVSWEAPSRDGGVTSTYQYLSALSHGFDSQSLSISDLAHTIASNSNTETARSPPSPVWAENESPFSTLFARSAAPPRSTPTPRVRNMARTYSDDAIDALGDSSVPSLPPPDLGGNLDMLRSATAGARASSAVATPNAESSSTSHTTRPPTPPSTNPYTGPFRLTMQRRGEFARRSMESQRRIPDPPSIPPLHFGADFDNSSSSEERSDSRRRLLAQLSTERQSYEGRSERFADMERRLYNYPGPGPASSSHAQNSDSDPRRFFPSRPIPTSSGPLVDEEHLGHRYSARDMHNVLARQARLEGSRLTTDLPSPYRPSRDDTDGVDLSHDGFSTSRAHRLISRFHEQAEAEARESSSSSSTSPWAALPPRRSDTLRADAEARRRRVNATRTSMYDDPSTPFRHRASRDPAFHAMFAQHGPNARFRRRALGDYVRDEDFDGSYETLLSLSGLIGDVKPKATPDDVVAGLDTATYKDWATAESDQRCPICLDDYQPSDPVQKLGDCRHWLHKECLEQWLKGASTCPVCRKDVKGKGKARRGHHHHHHGPGPSRRRDDDGPGGSGGPSTGGGGSGGPPHYWLDFLRD